MTLHSYYHPLINNTKRKKTNAVTMNTYVSNTPTKWIQCLHFFHSYLVYSLMNQIHHVTQPVRLKVMLIFQNCSVPYYYQNGSITEGVTSCSKCLEFMMSKEILFSKKKHPQKHAQQPTSILARGYSILD